MTLQYRFFAIPATDAEGATEELNRFLRSVRVINTQRELVIRGEAVYWAVAVEYLSGGADDKSKSSKQKIDYKEVLSPEDFAVFAKLREWRKAAAEKEEVPVYNIFTNDQLAQIVRQRIKNKAALKAIEGIGDARVAKYGEAIISAMADAERQENPAP